MECIFIVFSPYFCHPQLSISFYHFKKKWSVCFILIFCSIQLPSKGQWCTVAAWIWGAASSTAFTQAKRDVNTLGQTKDTSQVLKKRKSEAEKKIFHRTYWAMVLLKKTKKTTILVTWSHRLPHILLAVNLFLLILQNTQRSIMHI